MPRTFTRHDFNTITTEQYLAMTTEDRAAYDVALWRAWETADEADLDLDYTPVGSYRNYNYGE